MTAVPAHNKAQLQLKLRLNTVESTADPLPSPHEVSSSYLSLKMAATDAKKKTYNENGHHPKTANDKEKKPKSIYDKANILSKIFCW